MTVWGANKEQSKIKVEGFSLNFKANKWLIWSECWELYKKNVPRFGKNLPDKKTKGFT